MQRRLLDAINIRIETGRAPAKLSAVHHGGVACNRGTILAMHRWASQFEVRYDFQADYATFEIRGMATNMLGAEGPRGADGKPLWRRANGHVLFSHLRFFTCSRI